MRSLRTDFGMATTLRWVRLVDSPTEARVLAPLVTREIVARLLQLVRAWVLLPIVGAPTAGVTRWWVRQDNAILAGLTSSYAKCLKTRRLPPVGWTLC